MSYWRGALFSKEPIHCFTKKRMFFFTRQANLGTPDLMNDCSNKTPKRLDYVRIRTYSKSQRSDHKIWGRNQSQKGVSTFQLGLKISQVHGYEFIKNDWFVYTQVQKYMTKIVNNLPAIASIGLQNRECSHEHIRFHQMYLQCYRVYHIQWIPVNPPFLGNSPVFFGPEFKICPLYD